MTTYKIVFAKSAQKELRKLPTEVSLRIAKTLQKLADNPRRGSVRPMIGTTSWRLRVGDYRVVYDIHDKEFTVLVLRTRHRKDVYKK
jgi:mRNA interferase RelE/StbE